MSDSTLHLEQGFEYKNEDWWEWWIWLEGSDAELASVDKVVYTLHPTFPKPVRTVDTRKNKFMLKTAGWGTFRVYAQVLKRDGSKLKLQHDLVLEYPDGTPTTA